MEIVEKHLRSATKPLIVVLGPTASGKTTYAIELAKSLGDAEIVNADSRQLYKGMDVGTAKVTQEEMQGVPHHMLDMLNPNEDSTAAWFQKEAKVVIDNLHLRGVVPILTGGSMLYIAAITDGLSFDRTKRDELRSPASVCEYDLCILGLGKNREEVVAHIDSRTALLFEKGWVEEVQGLLERGYTKNDRGFKACGYREIAEYLETGEPDASLLQQQIAAKTRQYARRQMTWWKGDTRINWL